MERDILKKAMAIFSKDPSDLSLHAGSSGLNSRCRSCAPCSRCPAAVTMPGASALKACDAGKTGNSSQEIAAIHRESDGTYGSPKIHRELRRRGKPPAGNRVARLMRKDGLHAKTKRKFKVTTDSRHNLPVAPNLLDRSLIRSGQTRHGPVTSPISGPPKGGYTWRSSWTCTRVALSAGPWRSGSRALGERCGAHGLQWRSPPRGVLHHSDRGSQYASDDYQELLTKNGMLCSMSRKGNCWDNAPVESFFSTLKREWVFHQRYHTRDEARQSIFDYIERFYNRQRIHSSLGYRTPMEFEQRQLAA